MNNMKNMKNVNKKFDFAGCCHGITTLGERGQIVIPQEARKELKLKQKDKLFVFSKLDSVLVLVKMNELQKVFDSMLPKGLPLKIVTKLKKKAKKK
jgi:AbrB family looped-hinge helix DNA binding protein